MSFSHSTGGSTPEVPMITQVDLLRFHEQHFCTSARDHFSSQFMQRRQQYAEHEENHNDDDDDDGLGYYADGVKRTLTDEQIEIFRHSELEALRKRNPESSCLDPLHFSQLSTFNDSERDADGDADAHPARVATDSTKKKKRRGKGRKCKTEEKVDLRKRTWDVVEAGLVSLDYDEAVQSGPPPPGPSKRRQVSYEDGP